MIDNYFVSEDLSAKLDNQLNQIQALYALPGDKVRSPDNYDGQTLTVKSVHLSQPANEILLEYEFLEVPGKHNGLLFSDASGFVATYGTLITRNGQSYLCAEKVLDQSDNLPEQEHPANVFVLSKEMTRSGRYQLIGADASDDVMSNYFLSHEDGPATGEFSIAPNPLNNQVWDLVYSPWMASASADDVLRSESAISQFLAPQDDELTMGPK